MNTVLLPGVLAGVAIGLVFALLNSIGADLAYDTHEIVTIAAIVVAIFIAQVFAVIAQPAPTVQAFLPRYFAAVLASVSAAIVYGVIAWIYFALIDTTYLGRFYEQYVERARELATSPAEREQLVAAAEKMKDFVMDPFSQAMVQFGTVLMLGLLTGLIVSVVARPKS